MAEFEENQLENAAESMEQAMKDVQEVKVGDIVKGEVLSVEDKQIIVGILGSGVEGVVPAKELSQKAVDDLKELVKVGDVLDLVVITAIGKDKENGSYLLSKRRIDAKKVWDQIEDDYKAEKILNAKVTDIVKGGLVVDLGVRGFIPASMVEDHFVSDFKKYIGQELAVKIIELEPSENRLIVSHREVVLENKNAQKEEALKDIEQDAVIEGKVARLTDFGAFIDLGGIDGLVHVSEIANYRVEKPADVLEVGEVVNVKVLSVDKEQGKVSLSIKATQPGPWEGIEEKAHVGTVLEGVIKRLTSFGAFVELFPGVEGLVHISQISHKHIATPHEVLQEGETVKVKVIDLKPEEKRIGLSIKALQEKPVEEKKVQEVEEENYELPEETTGFNMGDLLGDQLKDLDDK